MKNRVNTWLAAFAVSLFEAGAVFAASESPIQEILDGRSAAEDTNLTKDGVRQMAQDGTNILLYGAGFIGIVMVAMGIYRLYNANMDEDVRARRSAYSLIGIGSFMTIPAIVSAISLLIIGVE